ncbi:MAG: hypothetical protein WBM77_14635 [Maribacter sp.]
MPVTNGSLSNLSLNVKSKTSIQEINDTFERASQNELKNIHYYMKYPIVFIVINNSCYSCTFDSQKTSVIGNRVNIIGWYDNETGYCGRIIDIINLMLNKIFV